MGSCRSRSTVPNASTEAPEEDRVILGVVVLFNLTSMRRLGNLWPILETRRAFCFNVGLTTSSLTTECAFQIYFIPSLSNYLLIETKQILVAFTMCILLLVSQIVILVLCIYRFFLNTLYICI